MKKLLLMLLLVVGGVMTASAADDIYLRCNLNSTGENNYYSWNFDTNKGQGSEYKFTWVKYENGEDVYTYTIDASNFSGDIYFRPWIKDWGTQIAPANNSFNFPTNAISSGIDAYFRQSTYQSVDRTYNIIHSTIKASEYKITIYKKDNGSWDNDKMYIVVDIVSMPLSVSALGYSTFSCAYPLNFASITEVNAYRAESAVSGSVKLAQFTGAVPAATGLLIKSNVSGEVNINVPVVDYTGEFTNMLKASVTATELVGGSTNPYRYILAGNDASTIGFYFVNQTRNSGAGKAYLESISDLKPVNSGARVSWIFEDQETTGINSVKSANLENEVYNLNGQRVNNAVRGLYIVNGKKVIMK